jgi:hypothetical protein
MPKWIVCAVVECLSSKEPPSALAHLLPLQIVAEQDCAEALRAECAEPPSAEAACEGPAHGHPHAHGQAAAEECSTSSEGSPDAPGEGRPDFLLPGGKSSSEMYSRSALMRSTDFALPADGWMGAADLCSPPEQQPRLGASAEGLRFDFLEAI